MFLRSLLNPPHWKAESESYTFPPLMDFASGLVYRIFEPQSAQNTSPDRRCVFVPLDRRLGLRTRRRWAVSHVSWSMMASWVSGKNISSSGVAGLRFLVLKFSQTVLPRMVCPRYSRQSRMEMTVRFDQK